ncbi:hypothetical protein FCULG_00010957 [Fusarium culmorum]|uniref:F-box domain-containing protein n=1 Tax=Fusarium culmorum TaxID=5516 RepID=A0A2T4GZU2_FUSCU|nr:hypothetical protein FCULG_00010957 [Fusarium culmorum]
MGNTDTRQIINPDAVFHGDKIQKYLEGRSSITDLADFSQPAIPLQQLIITNLPDNHDDRLDTSESFLKLMSMASLRDLRLHVEARRDLHHPVRAPDGSSPFSPGKYKFFNNLHVSWLAPDIAKNLQTLTLHCKDFWGCHQWQIDWFASIGKLNGSGGLEELYLHDCPILYEATHIGPFDTFDPGYPLLRSVLGIVGERETHKYPIRWHAIFSQWARSLNKLKVFHMGRSTYQNSLQDTFTKTHQDVQDKPLRQRIWYDLLEELASPCPSGPVTYSRLEHASNLKGQMTSIKFNQNQDFQMKYIKYNIERERDNAHWPWVHPGESYECWAPEEGTVMRDDAAYEMLMDAVYSRAV